jgi:hypothetical protein
MGVSHEGQLGIGPDRLNAPLNLETERAEHA